MRLFVAVWPPDEVLTELAAAVEALRPLAPDLRWVPPEHWHLTLAFLGEVDDARRQAVTERLARAASRHAPPRLRLDAGGRFGDRVLFTRVTGDVDPLRRLAAAAGAAARRAGIDVEDRPYRPHLTLARGRPGSDLRPVVASLTAFHGTGWTAARLHLVRSRLGQGAGGRSAYDVLDAWDLTGRPVPARGHRAARPRGPHG